MYRSQPQKIVATIEARMTSSRLPGKVLLDLAGKPALQQLVERLRRSRYLDEVVVATTDRPTDDPVAEMCRQIGCSVFRGSEDDVLARVLGAANSVSGDLIVEITGDCPAVDWRHVDQLIETFLPGNMIMWPIWPACALTRWDSKCRFFPRRCWRKSTN